MNNNMKILTPQNADTIGLGISPKVLEVNFSYT